MKIFRLHLLLLGLFALSALSVNAAQLASAKVLEVIGTVTKYTEAGGNAPLQKGDILSQGDSISATALSSTKLVFSNGSTLTIKENTSITIAELAQESFGGNNSYEQLEADPSKSQALLELNYGEISGHVKKLQSGSRFDIQTPLGTAAIRGTQFTVKLFYNAERGEFLLTVVNEDGEVQIISRYLGEFQYGADNFGDKGYNSALSDDGAPEAIPEKHTIIIRLSENDPYFDTLFNLIQNYIPTGPTKGWIELPVPEITPEDLGIIIVSPEDEDDQGENNNEQ